MPASVAKVPSPSVASKSNASAASSPEPASPSFEDAMHRLESIVEAMESGDTPLADLLAKFEEGSKLLAVCETRLKTAELKIEQLKRRKDGTFALDAFASPDRPEAG